MTANVFIYGLRWLVLQENTHFSGLKLREYAPAIDPSEVRMVPGAHRGEALTIPTFLGD
jgi:hypothetical protein